MLCEPTKSKREVSSKFQKVELERAKERQIHETTRPNSPRT